MSCRMRAFALIFWFAPWLAAQTLSSFSRPYQWEELAPVDLSNSNRLDSLLRAGNIYLSLQDAIALALENNLDIAYQRYTPLSAQANLLRVQAGASSRSLGSSVQTGATEILSQVSGGSSGTGTTSGAPAANLSSGGSSGNLDPSITFFGQLGHYTTPNTNSFTVGTNTVVNSTRFWQFNLQQGFLTGTTASLGWNAGSYATNASRSDFNPWTSGKAELVITQRLLQGFGLALNRRNIRIAKNSQKVAALQFREQVSSTVRDVISGYWDLVSLYESLNVSRQALELAQTLYENTKHQVRIGTTAAISTVQAQAEVVSNRQQVAAAAALVRRSETAMKTALSRIGVASPALAEAHIIPTDRITVPEQEQVTPVQDLVAKAFAGRPEIMETRINIDNTKLALKGTKNALLPALDFQADFVNNGLAGQSNLLGAERTIDPFFIGGFGTAWSQILSRNFPDYSIGFQLSIPLRNRVAKSDMIANQIALRQQEIGRQRQLNSIRAEVQNALADLEQARITYEAAVESRGLAERLLEGERKKYELGTTDLFFVVNYQRALAVARSAEVTAQSTWAKAKAHLDYVTGDILETNNVSIAEAMQGRVSRPPSELPVVLK